MWSPVATFACAVNIAGSRSPVTHSWLVSAAARLVVSLEPAVALLELKSLQALRFRSVVVPIRRHSLCQPPIPAVPHPVPVPSQILSQTLVSSADAKFASMFSVTFPVFCIVIAAIDELWQAVPPVLASKGSICAAFPSASLSRPAWSSGKNILVEPQEPP